MPPRSPRCRIWPQGRAKLFREVVGKDRLFSRGEWPCDDDQSIMDRMGEAEREPDGDRRSVQFIGTICQQDHAGGAPEVDGPESCGAGGSLIPT